MRMTDYIPPSENTHFLVSGGGKGITAACAVALAHAYRCTFTLLGRSQALAEEPGWARELETDTALKGAAVKHFQAQGKSIAPKAISREVNRILSSRKIQHTLNQIREAGSQAEYLSADLTNLVALKEKLGSTVGKINAVLHGAGALADKYIEDKTESDFDLVYGVKVGGLKNILTLIPPGQLDYLILFSSVAGFYGNAGQTDYSLSNEVLNKLGHYLKESLPKCQVLSLDWGPWDGGMVTPQLKRILIHRNIPLISLKSGTEILIDLLKSPQEHPQYVIGSPLPLPSSKPIPELRKYRIQRDLSLERNPFLADHVIGGNAVLPTVCAVNWFINSCQSLYPGYEFFAVRDYSVFKGIIVKEETPQQYMLELQELAKSVDAVRFAGKISSRNGDGRKSWHYQAIVELMKKPPDRPRIAEIDVHDDSVSSGESLYASRILFHGPSFQGIDRVLNISDGGLTTSCQLGPRTSEQMGQFPVRNFNHCLADVHLQSMLIWAHLQKGSLGLPLKIASGIQYHKPPAEKQTYATMKVRSVNGRQLVADVISHDQQGLIYSEVTGAEITLKKNLYELFQNNHLGKEPV